MASLFMRRVEVGLRAAAEALFPTNDEGIPDWRDAEVVPRTLEYLSLLPPDKRRLVGTLYVGLELLPPLTLGDPRPFSLLPVARRTALVRGWRSSRNPAFKMLGDALKAQLTMMYLSHPVVLAHAGEHKVNRNPDDPYQPEIRPDALGAP